MYALLELSLLVLSLLEDLACAQQYTAVPRWGQASTLVNDVLFIHGGRTDEFNAYGYSSAPVNNDILYLSLNTSFDPSSPPWQYVAGCANCSSSQGPAVAWHTLTPFNTSALLLFGGDAGPNGPIAAPEEADSAALLDASDRLTPVWNLSPDVEANQPLRRIYHTAAEVDGKVYLIGGEKADGSGNAFSEHYVYDAQGPSFTQLPTTSGPSDMFGHASVVLPDRRLIVFGGYSPSENTLLPFSTIWSLDTSNHTWSLLQVSNTNIPSPRRGFAAVTLDNGNVLIHGGADAAMQNVFSDGWMLDTTQNPMVWSAVDALSQMGPRRDHFAVALGSEVILGFGYAQFSPANANLVLFDAGKGEFISSFTPPPAVSSPTMTTLPGSSPTSHFPSGTAGASSGTHGSSPTTSTGNPDDPNGTGGGNPQGDSSRSHATAVVLGVIFGVLGLLAGGAAAYYLSTRRAASQDSFHLLGPSDDSDGPQLGSIIPAGTAGVHEKSRVVVQNMKQKLAGLVSGRTAHPARRDMLADEDTRVFEPSWYDVRREGSIGSWSTGGRLRPRLGDMVQGSLTSLKNVGGAMLAYAAGNRKPREASEASTTTYWEKDMSYQYSDKASLVGLPDQKRTASRPKGGRQASHTSQWSNYEDPFADYEVEEFKLPHDEEYDSDAVELLGAPSLRDPPPRPYMYSRVARATDDVTRLTPLSEKPSLVTMTGPTSSSSDISHTSPLNPPSSSEHSRSSHDASLSPRRPSSIIDANPMSMKRSDSWWSKLSKTPLLDRARSTDSVRSRTLRPLEFRDPNPPPRLVPIKESSNSLPPDDQPSKRDESMYTSIHHGRSVTSLQTSKTADSAEIERMGHTMDIVQNGTVSSHTSHVSSYSDASYEPDRHSRPSGPISVVVPAADLDVARPHRPLPMTPNLVQSSAAMSPASPVETAKPSPLRRPTAVGSVAARVEAFEQQTRSPPPPPPSRRNTGVYGLAPKPSLFIANPDRRKSSADS